MKQDERRTRRPYRRPRIAPARACVCIRMRATPGLGRSPARIGAAGAQTLRYVRASCRRFISSCVMSRCNVFSVLPGSDTKRNPS